MCLSPGSPRPRKSVRGRCLEPDIAGNWFAQFGQYAYCITAVDHSSARGWWSVVCYLPLQLFFFRLLATARGILVPWPGIKPMAPAVEVWSLNHWTTGKSHSPLHLMWITTIDHCTITLLAHPVSFQELGICFRREIKLFPNLVPASLYCRHISNL